MSKVLTRLALAALAASLCAASAAAQTTLEWIVLSPAGEGFTARMPKQPAVAEQQVRADGLSVSGRRYAAGGDGGATFIVWSLKDPEGAGRRPAEDYGVGVQPRYLDQVAELAWELLVRPETDRLKKDSPEWAEAYTGMAYRQDFILDGRRGRSYFLTLKEKRGPVYVCADGTRIYIVAALAADPSSLQLEKFTGSFALEKGAGGGLPAPLISTAAAEQTPAVRPGPEGIPYIAPNVARAAPTPETARGDAPVDYGKTFNHSEVTKKALITDKPEPGYTESARKFNVTGVVRMRAILDSSGVIRNLSVVKGLPHGLTERAIAAARQIRFEPAQKDGRAVSQYIVLEYNFNIY